MFMTVIVSINSEYARDQQVYLGGDLANSFEQPEEENWRDVSGPIILAVIEADSVESAIKRIAADYGCPPDRFTGFRIIQEVLA
jgi:hypothetical protein